ncbi:MAG: YggT family protein [Actinomycetaceae bacterium]|nr:YggT family protein [Arcanobacterium sp.]MDD7687366.1 YggT family protein [Actinomycetaceae bacterium]MDY5274135.1 YggT family protein [Arcanobacterium sp.]
MYLLGLALYWLCRLYILVLLARVVFDFIQIFKPDWRPQGIVLVIGTWVYRLTDPPLRFLARFIPPLRLGTIALDVGFVVLYFAVKLVQFGAYVVMMRSLM